MLWPTLQKYQGKYEDFNSRNLSKSKKGIIPSTNHKIFIKMKKDISKKVSTKRATKNMLIKKKYNKDTTYQKN